MFDRKVIQAIIISVAASAAVGATKAYVDVEKLKTNMDSIYGMLADIKTDVREIRKYQLNQRRKE